jgi:hypothetical protein
MHNTKRQIAFSVVLALLLYLVPNFVQDLHRFVGHHHFNTETNALPGSKLGVNTERCNICLFEFTVSDEIGNHVFFKPLQNAPFLFPAEQEYQVQNKVFQYYNLRAPPQYNHSLIA